MCVCVCVYTYIIVVFMNFDDIIHTIIHNLIIYESVGHLNV